MFENTVFSVARQESGQMESSGICLREVKLHSSYEILTKKNPKTPKSNWLEWILPHLTMKIKTMKCILNINLS